MAVSAAFDSARTVTNALSASVWLSTSACSAVGLAKTDFAVAKTSFAAEIALASAFLAATIRFSKLETASWSAVLLAATFSTAFSAVALGASTVFSSATFLSSASFWTGAWSFLSSTLSVKSVACFTVMAVSSTCLVSLADTAPFPRNIKPAAIATDAAPKLYLRIP